MGAILGLQPAKTRAITAEKKKDLLNFIDKDELKKSKIVSMINLIVFLTIFYLLKWLNLASVYFPFSMRNL